MQSSEAHSEAQLSRHNSLGLNGLTAVMAAAWVIGSAGHALGETGVSTNSPADAAQDPVLGLMLEKGMITEEEANKVQAQVDARRTNMAAAMAAEYNPPSKWIMSAGIKNMEIFGDLRLRYEDREADDPGGFKNPKPGKHGPKELGPGKIDLNRMRYAFRVGLRGDAFDDFYYGFRMDTSPNPRSSFVTLGTSSSGTPYYGPFGKSTSGIDVSMIYLGWHPESWLDVTVGKMSNPLYTSSMVWSPTITPEGAAEHLKYGFGPVDLFANAGQFLYYDTSPGETTTGYFNPLAVNSSSQPFLMALQGGTDVHFTKQVDLKVAPAFYWYTALNNGKSPGNTYDTTPGFADVFVGQGTLVGINGASAYYNYPPAGSAGFDGFAANQTGINDLLVLEVPFEFTVKLKQVEFRAFGDYAKNLEGSQRARAAYLASRSSYFSVSGAAGYSIVPISAPQYKDNTAYQFGLAVASHDGLGLVNGSTAKRHAWEVRTYWQHVEQYSLDPNLIDLDFFEGVENLEGIYVAAAFGFTENFIGTFRYGHAYRINSKLGTGGSGLDIPQMNPINEFSLFQVDLTYKF